MRYVAYVHSDRTDRVTGRPFDDAEVAARSLFVLMRADGWPKTETETVKLLLTGKRVRHKRRTYRVARVHLSA